MSRLVYYNSISLIIILHSREEAICTYTQTI
ncbi:hypothetical protein ERAN111884_08565 [Erysipelothrix anatis]